MVLAIAGINVGNAFPIPELIVTIICEAAPASSGRLSRIPLPKAPRSCIPASTSLGNMLITIARPSLRTVPNEDIAPDKPPSLNAVVNVERAFVPNCTNSRRLGVSSSEITICAPSSAL